jgi:hypothetical protein
MPDRPAGFTDFLHIGSHFTIQFRNAKEQPSLLVLHFPSLRLTIHIPSHSEAAARVSQPSSNVPGFGVRDHAVIGLWHFSQRNRKRNKVPFTVAWAMAG